MKTITIDPAKILDLATNLNTGQKQFIGQVFAYLVDDLLQVVEEAKENLDLYLTRYIGLQLHRSALKSQALFFYAPFNTMIKLIACVKEQQGDFGWLRDLPGYYDSGQGYAPEHAVPFLYWNGEQLYRILEQPEDYEPGDFLICDFGALAGLSTETTELGFYDKLRKEPAAQSLYSAIPRSAVEGIWFNERTQPVEYMFFEWGPTPAPKQDSSRGFDKSNRPLTPEEQERELRHRAGLISPPQGFRFNFGRCGFYQQCASCDWVGEGLDKLVDRCPKCGGETDPDALLFEGGMMIWSNYGEFYFCHPRCGSPEDKFQGYDVPLIINLMEYWKYHPKNREWWTARGL